MNIHIKTSLFCILLSSFLSSCYEESRLLVKASFIATVTDDSHTAPVSVSMENKSTGADFYKWTFEGGDPVSSDDQTPPSVTYGKAGTYRIVLEAWNNYERDSTSFTFTVDSAVTVNFDAEVLINSFAPAQVHISNNTVGASGFQWTFEGGEPSFSEEQYPQDIRFDSEGEHVITLTASNGGESFTLSKSITLAAPLSVDFDIIPSFDDFDYQVPFTAELNGKTVSGLTYLWACSGADIVNPAGENTGINISGPGTYTVTLTAGNGKETKTAEQEITVTANSNLFTVNDVKFGIKAAANTLGSFYSLSERKILQQDEITASNGNIIDIIFFGLDAGFNQSYFISPSQAGAAGFYAIPNAAETFFVNDIAASSLTFTSADFDSMTDDSVLRSLHIREAGAADTWFNNFQIPRYVLFETASGRKGAIKIKAFVSEGQQSYILTDIKFQKAAVE